MEHIAKNHETGCFGTHSEVDIKDVLRERFSSSKGVVVLWKDMSDEMLLLTIKDALSFSNGKAFTVIPSV